MTNLAQLLQLLRHELLVLELLAKPVELLLSNAHTAVRSCSRTHTLLSTKAHACTQYRNPSPSRSLSLSIPLARRSVASASKYAEVTRAHTHTPAPAHVCRHAEIHSLHPSFSTHECMNALQLLPSSYCAS
eukprot:6199343-Pleurochrysis_carterae.AAC.2